MLTALQHGLSRHAVKHCNHWLFCSAVRFPRLHWFREFVKEGRSFTADLCAGAGLVTISGYGTGVGAGVGLATIGRCGTGSAALTGFSTIVRRGSVTLRQATCNISSWIATTHTDNLLCQQFILLMMYYNGMSKSYCSIQGRFVQSRALGTLCVFIHSDILVICSVDILL